MTDDLQQDINVVENSFNVIINEFNITIKFKVYVSKGWYSYMRKLITIQ